jgi:hypothetical protein
VAPLQGATFSFHAGLVALSDGVVLLGVEDPAGRLDPARIAASGRDGPVRPPFSWHRVQTRGGAVLLLVAPAQAALAAGGTLRLTQDAAGDAGAGGAFATAPSPRGTRSRALLGTADTRACWPPPISCPARAHGS